MNDITGMLAAIGPGDLDAADRLLPLVYDQLRRLAAAKLAREGEGQTLDATALVHEAYLRLVGNHDPGWDGQAHFFGAAARAMHQILIDNARHKASLVAGGGFRKVEFEVHGFEKADKGPSLDLIALDEALTLLETRDRRKAEVVRLRFFAGLTNAQAARALGISESTAENDWAYARTWLRLAMDGEPG